MTPRSGLNRNRPRGDGDFGYRVFRVDTNEESERKLRELFWKVVAVYLDVEKSNWPKHALHFRKQWLSKLAEVNRTATGKTGWPALEFLCNFGMEGKALR